MSVKIKVETLQYEWAHGKAPRGRGSWAFEMSNSTESEVWFSAWNTTFVEARKQAQEYADYHGYTRIQVGT